MAKNILLNNETLQNVSNVILPLVNGGNATFKDIDEVGGVTTGTFEISEDTTEQIEITSLNVQNGYIIALDEDTKKNTSSTWICTEVVSGMGYSSNDTSFQINSGNGTFNKTNKYASISNGHPLIKSINSTFPIKAGRYKYIVW